jgi:transcriptional regulator with XRE-family HTH domain
MTKGHQNYRRTICDSRFGFALGRGAELEDPEENYPSTKYPRILSAVRQRALGEFLRKHRELATQPADDKRVGERRRRTSGLRREEVAELAGISSTWYARLEQGQEVRPSSAALGRIAEVLRLAPAERAYLFNVAQRADPNEPSNFADEPVSKAIESCVLSISYPACVLDRYWIPLFWNAEWADLFPLWLKGPEKNLLRYIFLDPGVRTLVVDWELRARRLLAQFRVDFGKYIDDPKMLDLVRRLSEESDLFRRIWEEQQVLFLDEKEKSHYHPQWGLLKFFQTTFVAVADPALKLVILQPCS